MSKYISRLAQSSYPYAGRLQLKSPATLRTPFRAQTSGASDPMKGKGPISWRNFSVLAVAAAGSLGFFYYVKNEKDVGRFSLNIDLELWPRVLKVILIIRSHNEGAEADAGKGSDWRQLGIG